jgi:hypothetical protein
MPQRQAAVSGRNTSAVPHEPGTFRASSRRACGLCAIDASPPCKGASIGGRADDRAWRDSAGRSQADSVSQHDFRHAARGRCLAEASRCGRRGTTVTNVASAPRPWRASREESGVEAPASRGVASVGPPEGGHYEQTGDRLQPSRYALRRPRKAACWDSAGRIRNWGRSHSAPGPAGRLHRGRAR